MAFESPAPASLYELSSCLHLRSCSCKFCGRQVVQRTVRTLLIVILPPAFNLSSRVTETREPVRVQTFISEPAVETFHKGIRLHRQLHRQVTLRSKRSETFIRSIRGVAADSNWLRIKAPGVRTASISITKISN